MFAIYDFLTQQHQPWLVVLAGLICLFASVTVLNLMHRALLSAKRVRLMWLVATAVATGSGIWSTHFVAMLAFEPGVPVGFDRTLTFLSATIAMVVPGLGLAVALGSTSWRRRGVGGAILGAGVCAMDYTGMTALRAPALIAWDPALISASIALGIGFGAITLPLALRGAGHLKSHVVAVLLLTLGICATHFTAVAALELTPSPLVPPPGDDALGAHALDLDAAGMVLAILFLGLAGAKVDQRFAQRAEREATRLQSLVNATFEGIAIHAGGTVVDANERLARLVGREPAQIVGRPVLDLFAPERRAEIEEDIERESAEPQETELLKADGSRVPVEILGRRMDHQGRGACVTAIRDVSERRQAEQRIWHMAHHDPLTGLPNRGLLHDRLEQALSAARRKREQMAVLALDLDRFKEVNDLRGHAIGDELLNQVAARLGDELRESDTLARLGGDEFVIVQPDVRQPEAAAGLAGRLVEAIARPFDLEGQAVEIGLSVGIAVYPDDGTTADALLVNADTALYRAKTDGRGVFRMFEAAMDAKLRERRALEHDLKLALARDELGLHFQPQVHSASGEVIGFEALLRWQHPERGRLLPADFIPLAENSHLILALGEWVLRAASREAASWPESLRVAVNVSPAQFCRGNLPALVTRILEETGLAPERLELEMTEGVLVKDPAQAFEILCRLKEVGVRLAMDDFGTGYSSLSYLQRFPFDQIKIDKSFTQALGDSDDAAAIVRAVIGLGRSLRLPVVAEGVETAAQLDMLRNEDCDEVQGFLLGRPLPIEDYRDLIAQRSSTIPPASPLRALKEAG